MNTWLPVEPLIPVQGYKKEKITVEFDSAVIDPKDIAATVDAWFNKDITHYSNLGRIWAKEHNWKALKPQYKALFQSQNQV
jgi:hypothetical protein